MDDGRLAELLEGVLDGTGVHQVRVVLEDAAELHRLLSRLPEGRLGVLALVQSVDRRTAEPRDRAGGFQGELPHLVLLVEAGLDLPDDIPEILHVRKKVSVVKTFRRAIG